MSINFLILDDILLLDTIGEKMSKPYGVSSRGNVRVTFPLIEKTN